MSDRLKGKRAFVTAAAVGIGRACAVAFAREGATVFATDIDEAKLAALKNEGIAEVAKLDVRDSAAVAAMARRAGKTDILLNAAGFVHHGTVLDCSDEDWDFSFDLNDMREQLLQMANMGGISGLMGMMPGVAKMKNQIAAAGLDDRIIKRQVAVIDSMTRQERKHPDLLKASRKRRIAAGAGQKVEEVNKLLKMHRSMADMMKMMGTGKRGPLAGIAQAMGFGGGTPMPTPEQMKALAEKMPKGADGLPQMPKDMPAGLRGGLPNLPGLTGLGGRPTLPGLGRFPGKKK
jgi:threonine dehydrogenase-like Zn-dependent dehydrogenase